MRILVMLLLDTLPMLGNVLLLCFFVFFIFGIIGVQLWEGILRQRCVLDLPKHVYGPEWVYKAIIDLWNFCFILLKLTFYITFDLFLPLIYIFSEINFNKNYFKVIGSIIYVFRSNSILSMISLKTFGKVVSADGCRFGSAIA